MFFACPDSFRVEHLPRDADNPSVWWHRCRRVHKYFPFTQEDHQRVIADAGKNLRDELDTRLAADAAELYLR